MTLPFACKKIWLWGCAVAFVLAVAFWAHLAYDKPYDDLPTFYWATQLVFNEQVSVYAPETLQQLGRQQGRKIYPFLYPPPSLLLFAPMLYCESYASCKQIFSILNLMACWALGWALCRLYALYCNDAIFSSWGMGIILMVVGIYAPVLDTFRTGQINFWVLLATLPSFWLGQGKWFQRMSGVLLALAIILKVYLLVLLPVLLMFRRWQSLSGCLVCLMVLSVLSLVLLPWELWRDWIVLGRGHGGYADQIPYVLTIPWNQSLNGFFIRQFLDERILGAGSPHAVWIYATVACCVFVSFGVMVYSLLRRPGGDVYALALALLLVPLVAPLTWQHHYVFALPAAVCVLAMQRPLWQRRPGEGLPVRPPWGNRVLRWGCASASAFGTLGLAQPSWVVSLLSKQPLFNVAMSGITWWNNMYVSMQLMAGLTLWMVFLVCCMTLRKVE